MEASLGNTGRLTPKSKESPGSLQAVTFPSEEEAGHKRAEPRQPPAPALYPTEGALSAHPGQAGFSWPGEGYGLAVPAGWAGQGEGHPCFPDKGLGASPGVLGSHHCAGSPCPTPVPAGCVCLCACALMAGDRAEGPLPTPPAPAQQPCAKASTSLLLAQSPAWAAVHGMHVGLRLGLGGLGQTAWSVGDPGR